MPSRPPRPSFPGHVVTAVVVSHDGLAWLPECLDALAGQRRPPQRVVAVDTGSVDGAPQLLADTLGESAVVRLSRRASLGAAVQAGLDAFQGAPLPAGAPADRTEWVWVLHDDCAPEPAALEELLRQVEDAPSVVAVGPKVVAWSNPRRLLEVGRTVDSSGRLHVGVEPGELDQGQVDEARDVLASGSAGLLVRRDVWDELHGFDRTWPLFGEDVDFGWRAAAAGHRVRVAPDAVVRHVAALTGSRRHIDAVTGRPGTVARRHAFQLVLANTSPLLVPLLLLRWLVESVLVALALLVVQRRPGAALDELAGFAGTLARPGLVFGARRRRRSRRIPHRALRGLMAPASLRWRRLGDAIAEALGGGRAVEERRQRRLAIETGPVAAEAEAMQHDDAGALLETLRRPGVLLFLALTLISLVAFRHLFSVALHGGRLLPAPAGASDLWATYRAGWHPVDLGSGAVAPPAVALLALWSGIWLGKAGLAVTVLLLGAVPMAGVSAYLAARGVTATRLLPAWAAVVYATMPVTTAAVAGGRIDVVAAIVVLPWCVRSVVLALVSPARRWDRWVRAGVLLTVVAAFAPVLWCAIGVCAIGAVAVGSGSRRRGRITALATVLVTPLLLLAPWTWTVLTHPRLLVAGSGLPEALAAARPLGADGVLLAHPAGPGGAPAWTFAPFLAAGLVGLLRTRRTALARAGMALALSGMVAALVVSRLPHVDPADPAVRYWTGAAAALVALGCLLAAVIAAEHARGSLRRRSFGWRQPAAVVVVAAAVAGTVVMAGGWVVRGAQGPLSDSGTNVLPVFAAAQMAEPTAPRVLVLRASGSSLRYALIRAAEGPRLGDADVTSEAPEATAALSGAVQSLAAGQPSAVPALTEFGIGLVVVPGEQPDVLAKMASVPGLIRVPTAGAVVWRIDAGGGELSVVPVVSGRDLRTQPLPSGVDVQLVPAAAGSAHAVLQPGPAGRLLVLAETASPHWRATLDGTTLAPTHAYGWAQAWSLPADGGKVVVSRVGDHRGWWLLLELVLAVLALLLCLPSRDRTDPLAEPEPAEAD
jgi:GT2 family glycosyltransferase